jgi:flagellar hook-length control protein FliK
MRHFAIDLKEAAESYKPPFTRVTMKLNPERLGEVEVTLVQRGNNVHVNIQSNNASSVAFLAHNATELKAQLAGQGITNATMNFMSGGENQQQNPQNQQQQNRFQSYKSLSELESNDEQLSALEIILPHYA